MAYVLLLFTAILWGGSFIATRYALVTGGVGVFTLLGARYLIATAFILGLVLARGWEGIRREDRRYVLGISLIYPAACMTLETWGVSLSSAAVAAIVISSAPVMTALLARAFLKERLSVPAWIGIAVSMGGVAAVALLSPARARVGVDGRAFLTGAVLLVFAAALAAVYVVSARRLMVRYNPLTLTLAQDAFGAVFFAPLAVIELARHGLPRVDGPAVAAVCYLGIFASGVAFVLFNNALKTLEAARAALFLNLIPVFSVAMAWAVLGERLSAGQGAGGLAVVAGVALATLGRRNDLHHQDAKRTKNGNHR